MISNAEFIGNAKVVRYLDRVLAKGRISHAYLFAGAEHIGKLTLALDFAARILEVPAGSVLSDPDLIRIAPSPEEKQIGVESVREMQKSLSLFPFRARYKVAIIEKAEMLGPSAANSLLKTLEEPGETSVIILVASDAGKLLPTIKSRCQILNLNPVPAAEVERLIGMRFPHSDASEIAALSLGKPGYAISLAQDPELLRKVRAEKRQVLELFGLDNFAKMDDASKVYSLEKDEAAAVLDGWVAALRIGLLKSLEDGCGWQETERFRSAIDKTIATREEITERSVNVRLAIENLVLSFK